MPSPITPRRRASIPTNAIAYRNRRNVGSDKGEWNKAIADYDKAIALNAPSRPSVPPASCSLALDAIKELETEK